MNLPEILQLRTAFIDKHGHAYPDMYEIHNPIRDLKKSDGALNPARLGNADEFSMDFVQRYGWGQSTVGFHRVGDFNMADDKGVAYEGAAEYGIVRTSATARVAQKISKLHGAKDALVFPSGIKAITTFFQTYPVDRKQVVLLPEGTYFPTTRALDEKIGVPFAHYPSDAGKEEILEAIKQLEDAGDKVGMIYLETPMSQSFEIPDIDPIIAVAKEKGIMTAMDNTWANHIGFLPLNHGIDVVIQATTKYEGGYGDTESGVLLSKNAEILARTSRVMGDGTVSIPTCSRLFNRIDSTETRMRQQFETAKEVAEWLKEQPYVEDVIAPFLPHSPYYGRFQQYFNIGNGLFTVVFDRPAEDVEAFMDRSALLIKGESWGGHVTLGNRCTPKRPMNIMGTLSAKPKVRYSMGLEEAEAIIQSFDEAAPAFN